MDERVALTQLINHIGDPRQADNVADGPPQEYPAGITRHVGDVNNVYYTYGDGGINPLNLNDTQIRTLQPNGKLSDEISERLNRFNVIPGGRRRIIRRRTRKSNRRRRTNSRRRHYRKSRRQ